MVTSAPISDGATKPDLWGTLVKASTLLFLSANSGRWPLKLYIVASLVVPTAYISLYISYPYMGQCSIIYF